MNLAQTIIAALHSFDPLNAAYWTEDGLPVVDAVRHITGNQQITRDDITKAAPGFSREKPSLDEGVIAELAAPANAAQATPPATTEHPASVTATPPSAAPTVVNAADLTLEELLEDGSLTEQEVQSVLEALQGRLVTVRSQIEEMQMVRNKLEGEMRHLQKQEEAIDRRLNKFTPKNINELAIRGYLDRQAGHRQKRADEIQAAQRDNASLAALMDSIRTPLDSSMARRNMRGTLRPMVPFKNSKGE